MDFLRFERMNNGFIQIYLKNSNRNIGYYNNKINAIIELYPYFTKEQINQLLRYIHNHYE